MGRLHLPDNDELNPAQRAVYDEVVSGPRGRLIGPLRAVIHCPDLATRWSRLGEYLRYSTCLPPKLNELAILVTGRHWNSQLEFFVHAKAAAAAGLSTHVIESLRTATQPVFDDQAEVDIYEYARLLLATGTVTDEVHASIVKRWGEQGAVELTGLIGYYTMVAFTLNAHEIPLPDEGEPPLTMTGRAPTILPPASETAGAKIGE